MPVRPFVVLRSLRIGERMAGVDKRTAAGCSGASLIVGHNAGWTEGDKVAFFEALRNTSNVSEAARTIGKTSASAYDLKNRDPAFARTWMESLEQGYCELELLLLRHALHGSERVEVSEGEATRDGDAGEFRKTRTVHSYPYGMAMRLLLAHRSSVDAFRAAQGIDRPGSEEVRQEIYARLAMTRKRAENAGETEDDGKRA